MPQGVLVRRRDYTNRNDGIKLLSPITLTRGFNGEWDSRLYSIFAINLVSKVQVQRGTRRAL